MDPTPNISELVESASAEELARLLREHPDLARMTADDDNEQAIHFAALSDRADHLSLLLDAGAEINAAGNQGWTPLHYAAWYGAPAAARVLLDRGADKDKLDDTGFSPAFYGIRGRDDESVEVARMLVESGAHVDLNLAVCLGDVERVRQLLSGDSSAISHARFPNDLVLDAVLELHCRVSEELPIDEQYNMAANLRAMQRHDQILRILLGAGAPIDTPDFGWPPLFQSCQLHHPYVTELLLQHGANPNVQYRGDDLTSVLICTACRDEMLTALNTTAHLFAFYFAAAFASGFCGRRDIVRQGRFGFVGGGTT
jgi:ankyrin repeat protein